MKRVVLAVTATVAGLVLVLGFKTTSPHKVRIAALAPVVTPTTPPASDPSTQPPAAASPSPTARSTPAQPVTRTIDGSAADTQYGPVQVEITVSGGRITAARTLQVPNERQRDIEINDYAVPILDQETVSAQSASIDVVSGATYTSEGYAQSLQSALDQMRSG